jgi:hypothetical protein
MSRSSRQCHAGNICERENLHLQPRYECCNYKWVIFCVAPLRRFISNSRVRIRVFTTWKLVQGLTRVQPAELLVTRCAGVYAVNRGEYVEAVEVAVGVDAGQHPSFLLKGCCEHHAPIEMQ